AQNVARDLANLGVPQQDIHISDRLPQSPAKTPEEHRRGFVAWLEQLFSGESPDSTTDYQAALKSGKAVVAVDTDDAHEDDVIDVLENHGATHVHDEEPSSAKQQDIKQQEGTSTQSIPVIEEQVSIGKKTVVRGGVRVYSHVVEQPVEQQVHLRDEKVRIERRPANRPISELPQEQVPEKTIEIIETTEEPVVTKQRRVVEEVVITKESTERTEPVRETARRTEVKVEPLGASSSSIPSECQTDFQNNYREQYASAGGVFSDYLPAYEYGYRMGTDNRGKDFPAIEERLRTDYLKNHPQSVWDKVRGAMRYGYERATGKR
ncbi:MAG: YsnF/AvaK domain-containing protein, partial [Bryobacterales bacterium]|nr:YsnF/AvaK domain-containing protein [Bryobacterales bacterium]